MRKWLKRVGYALGALLLMLAAMLWWLLGTGGGLRFALAQTQRITDGALSVQRADGRLAGPLELRGVRYADGSGLDARIAQAQLDIRLWALLSRRAHVLNLDVDGVDVTLPKPAPEEPESTSSFSLRPPVDLLLDRVHVGKVRIAQMQDRGAPEPVFVSNRLDLAGRWTAKGIELHRLNLQAPDGHAELRGDLAISVDEQGDGALGFAWKIAGVDYAGDVEAHGNGKQVKVTLKLSQPMAAQVDLDLTQSGEYPWTAKVALPAFDPKPLLGDSSLKTLALDIQGSGNRHGGRIEGRVDLNGYALQLQPLSAHFSDDFNLLTLDELKLGSPQIKGTLGASGTIKLGPPPLNVDLALHWQDVLLPANLVGQDLASRGSLIFKGGTEQFHAEGDVDIGPPGKLAKLALNLDGTQKQLNLHTLELKQPRGYLLAKGIVDLQPALAWQMQLTADELDPGQLLAGWNGSLDMDIDTQGTLSQDQPDATVEIRKLDGRLRDRTIKGSGKLHVTPAQVLDGKLQLASGGSTVAIVARPGTSNDIDLELAIASLGDWLPDAAGRLDGNVRVRGKLPKLAVDAHMNGIGVGYAEQTIAKLQLTANIPDIGKPGGKLDLTAQNVMAGGLAFHQVALHGNGSVEQHSLILDAQGDRLSTGISLNGVLKGSSWNGTLSRFDLEPQGIPRWHLMQPTRLTYADGAVNLSELCLTAGTPQLCLAAKQDKAGNLDASYRLRELPLALLTAIAGSRDMPMRAEGVLNGNGAIRRNAAGVLSGNATLASVRGSITYVEHADRPLLSYTDLALNAELSPTNQRANLSANLNDGGRIDGQVSVSGAQQSLSGQIGLRFNDLGLIELFTNEVASVKGHLQGQFQLGGTLKQPAVTGRADVVDFAAEVPVVGLKLGQGRIAVSTTDAQRFDIQGSVQSGKGTLAIDGYAGIGQNAQTSLTLKGSQFTAADIPAAKVVISPDLVLKQDPKGIDIGGEVKLESADIDVSKLPGAGATRASPDVVVVDQQKEQEEAAKLPITAQIKVDLGRHTHLVGMGLDGRLSGVLNVSERPGRATTGQGQITVDGIYKAYGQNLQIEQGRLLFASTPIDNPGLDIRAARKLNPNATIDEGQKVGLYVSGTAQRPVLTVYSNPVMEQSDALSYLITGKPLSQVKGGEGSMVGAAAQALGSAAGDLLAKSIGSKIGVDDIGVSSNEALGGTSAFTVGKYLSPRLYLSYGVGLFEPGQVITLRYRLSKRWNFEAQNATDFSRASLNYRIEK
ncbi:MAG TPA: translocation/assembly module TamB domain-containing protein [Dyella sp.]|uniref:translocation/assembly module TamB domain-containing protein n=1 Tax=Dyella sp. TaxID=1869338 RepID=UPI002F95CBBA